MKKLTRGERFKDARIVHNQHGSQTMSEVQLATGVSASLIANLENDDKDRKANYIDVATLARHYGVTTDWLCGLSDDHHTIPCASSELGLSEGSIYFLKSLNDVRLAFDTMLSNFENSDSAHLSKVWNDAVKQVKYLSDLHGYELRAYANLCANYGPSLIDVLISAVEEDYRVIVDYSDLKAANPQKWDVEKERLSFDDFVRFKSGEISKAIDRCLLSKFKDSRTSMLCYDRVTDEVKILYKYED